MLFSQLSNETILSTTLLSTNHHRSITMVEWTMQLNNILQQRGETSKLTYQYTPEGPHNNCIWNVTALYKGVEVGRGSAAVKMQAKEKASEMAMLHLFADHHAALQGK